MQSLHLMVISIPVDYCSAKTLEIIEQLSQTIIFSGTLQLHCKFGTCIVIATFRQKDSLRKSKKI